MQLCFFALLFRIKSKYTCWLFNHRNRWCSQLASRWSCCYQAPLPPLPPPPFPFFFPFIFFSLLMFCPSVIPRLLTQQTSPLGPCVWRLCFVSVLFPERWTASIPYPQPVPSLGPKRERAHSYPGSGGAGVWGSSAAHSCAALQILAILYVLNHASTGLLMYNHP